MYKEENPLRHDHVIDVLLIFLETTISVSTTGMETTTIQETSAIEETTDPTSTSDMTPAIHTTTDETISSTFSSEMESQHTTSTMTLSVTTSKSKYVTSNDSCVCGCMDNQVNATINYNLLYEEFVHKYNYLRLDKDSLNTQIRKLTSAEDNRVTAKAAGGVAIVVLCIVIGLIMTCDLANIFKNARRKIRNWTSDVNMDKSKAKHGSKIALILDSVAQSHTSAYCVKFEKRTNANLS